MSKISEKQAKGSKQVYKFLVYGDINLNLIDGSAIWTASITEALASQEDVTVTLLLKAKILRTVVISRLMNLSKVTIIEPKSTRNIDEALNHIEKLDIENRYDTIILRGIALCGKAIARSTLVDRIWSYNTQMPPSELGLGSALGYGLGSELGGLGTEEMVLFGNIVKKSKYVLTQTQLIQEYINNNWPETVGRTKMLPPMIIDAATVRTANQSHPFKIVYAGKLAPDWGIRELFRSFDKLRTIFNDAELHIFGDKIHKPTDDEDFFPKVNNYLTNTKGVIWYRGVNRDFVMKELSKMHVCWAYRDANFEAHTMELSTKLLEYIAADVPIILTHGAINDSLLGKEYPLFANNEKEAVVHLITLAQGNPDLNRKATRNYANIVENHSMQKIGASLVMLLSDK